MKRIVMMIQRAANNHIVFAAVGTVGIALMIHGYNEPETMSAEPTAVTQSQRQETNYLVYPEHPMTAAMRAFNDKEKRKLEHVSMLRRGE